MPRCGPHGDRSPWGPHRVIGRYTPLPNRDPRLYNSLIYSRFDASSRLRALSKAAALHLAQALARTPVSSRAKGLLAATPVGKGVGALAARYGPGSNRPALKPNLIARRIVQLGEAQWVIKNPDKTKYYFFDEGSWELALLFDGTYRPKPIVLGVLDALAGR